MQATINDVDAQRPTDTESREAESPPLRYQTVRTSKMTFEASKIQNWVENQIPAGSTVLNLCAGKTKLDLPECDVIRVDVDREKDADLHVDAREVADHIETSSVDFCVFDPPFSKHQSRETYGTGDVTLYGEDTMSQIRDVLKPGGRLMQWAYSPILNRRFELESTCLWNRVGRGFDYVSTLQRLSPTDTGFPTVDTTTTAAFNPHIEGVTGGATFGGNNGADLEMSIRGGPDTGPEQLVLGEVDRLKRGVTLVITDSPRIHTVLDGRDTAIISVTAEASAHNHIGVRELSDRIPAGVIDTVVIDLDNDSFCWNTYYRDPDTHFEETTSKTGYVKALKLEATELLSEHGRLIQIGQTATNAPGGTEFERTHVALTATTDSTIAPFVTVDQRCGVDADSPTSDDLLWPMRHLNNERTRPSSFRYESDKEGMHHHPAVGVRCPECGVGRVNQCLTDDGSPAPSGSYHESRVDKGEEQFYGEGTLLPISEYLRERWFESATTDPARPKTAGGKNKTPAAVKNDNDNKTILTLADFH
jgi:hypothetical protein